MMSSSDLCGFRGRYDGLPQRGKLPALRIAGDPNPLNCRRGFNIARQGHCPLGGIFQIGIVFEQCFFHRVIIRQITQYLSNFFQQICR